jgi:choline-sulfatase
MMARNILFMYEASAAIPMIVAGPGVPEGKVSTTPVTLIDIGPTVLDAIGHDAIAKQEKLPGTPLTQPANAADEPGGAGRNGLSRSIRAG